MSRNGIFDAQILIHQLRKLNRSKMCIETLSFCCILHRQEAKQIVETWERQFYLSPRGQRVAFLFLANDIVQNNRSNGLEFVNEFWKVIPNALKDVVQNGGWDDKKLALRLVNIWEERRVFGSRLRFLKRELSDLLAAPSTHSLTNLHSSTAAGGVIGQSMSGDHPSDSNKRPRVDSDGPNSVHCYSPHPPSYPYPELPPPPPLPFDDEVLARASE